MLLSFEDAAATVREKLAEAGPLPGQEIIPWHEALGRVLWEDVLADRDYPPFDRATRDGYAVRSPDLTSAETVLRCMGEARAGKPFEGQLKPGQCVEIMTGAPVPAGAGAVVMVEDTEAKGLDVRVLRKVAAGENILRGGSEAARGAVVLRRGQRLRSSSLGLLASVGRSRVAVFRRPAVAVISTGDEVVPCDRQPEWFQIREGNAAMLAPEILSAGGVPRQIGIAPDEKASLRQMTREAFQTDLVTLSGGVSAGKYDLVKDVLAELGAEFFFDSVALRPGKPLVFGRAMGKFFFGLPGNPASTLVTFRLFTRAAIAMLGGERFEAPILLRARLVATIRQKGGLTRFLPARMEMRDGEASVTPVPWQGSGDLTGLAAANCFVVAHPEQTELVAGSWVDVWPE